MIDAPSHDRHLIGRYVQIELRPALIATGQLIAVTMGRYPHAGASVTVTGQAQIQALSGTGLPVQSRDHCGHDGGAFDQHMQPVQSVA